MVCKEELCTWFKHLSPHKRIDFMCGMLHMCLPMELRFLGSYVEDLAKKDFHQLRESEGKANSRHELSKFSETDERTFRTKMAVYLALLHSSNRICSNIIYKLLESHVHKALAVINGMDDVTIHSILLVLSMAMNHPAFSFSQRTKMFELYKLATDAADQIVNKMTAEQELLILSESCDTRSCDQHISPMCSPRVHLVPSPVLTITPQNNAPQHTHNTVLPDKVHVSDIEVKGPRKRESDTSFVEYHIQVTWSNGEKCDVFRTYQELVEFNTKLQQQYKQDIVPHSKFVKIPVLHNTQNHLKENTNLLNGYVSPFSSLPEHIQHSTLFSTFFGGPVPASKTPVQMTDAATSPRSSVHQDGPVVQHLNSGEDDKSVIEDYSSPPELVCHTYLTSQINGDVCSLSPQSPAHDLLLTGISHSPSVSTTTASPLISSPCQSPASSLESLSRTPPLCSPARHPEDNMVSNFLKASGLAMYSETLGEYTLEQLSDMLPEDLEAKGVPKNIAVNIKSLVDNQLREKPVPTPLPNGLIDVSSVTGGVGGIVPPLWQHPPHAHIPSIYTPPVHNYLNPVSHGRPLPHLAYQHSQAMPLAPPPPHIFSYPPYHQPHPQLGAGPVMGSMSANDVPLPLGGTEVSPSNSEYSSPSQSPHPSLGGVRRKPHLQQLALCSDSSSDDGDRDKRLGYKGQATRKSHSVPNSARCSKHDKQASLDMSVNTGSAPFPVKPGSDPAQYPGNHGNSGYTSDPTFTRRHKAQPAHTNMAFPQKCVISMPDSSAKGIPQPGMPIGFPQQVRDMPPAGLMGDLGQRHMLWNGATVLPRSHFSQMNGSRQMYAPSVVNTSLNVNQSVIASQANVNSSTTSVNSKVYQGPPAILASSGEKNSAVLNGSDGNSQSTKPMSRSASSEAFSNRISQVVTSSIPSSSSVTNSSASQSFSTAQAAQASCTSCGCPGHSHSQQVSPGLPYIPQTWLAYPNGLVPVNPMQVYFQHTSPYGLNGLNHDMIHNPMFAMQHTGTQGMPNVPPNLMYGNYYNYMPTSTYSGGYNRRPKKPNCHNCGSSKHSAPDCSEGSMEAMSGPMMYSYKPKTDSD